LFLAGVFFVSGWPKLIDSETTVRSVRAFQLLPESLVRPFAYGLPLLELSLALLLLLGLVTRIASLVTAGLMVMFMFGIAMAWARGLNINCGCFGNTGETVIDPVGGYIKDLFRDTGFLLLAALLIRWPSTKVSLDRLLRIDERTPATTRA
jgi:uncharacterized membrane protein YphA (DoxX/SURF4 family)